jgi:hypothetical protein
MTEVTNQETLVFCIRLDGWFAPHLLHVDFGHKGEVHNSLLAHAVKHLKAPRRPEDLKIIVIPPDRKDKSDPLGQQGYLLWSVGEDKAEHDKFTKWTREPMYAHFDVYTSHSRLAYPLPSIVKVLAGL